jgi:hypothetical protein
MEYVKLIDAVGFPIAAALAAGIFVFITVKFILSNVSDNIQQLISILEGLDKRIDHMTNDVKRIDIKISLELGLRPDYSLIVRAKTENERND